MILQSKAVYVRKQWIKCQNCSYEWLSETKVAPETRKKRVCCSKCRSSVTVTFSDDNDKNSSESPKLVKSIQEFEQVLDPQSALLWKKFQEAQKKNENAMNEAVQGLLDRHPASLESDDRATMEAKKEKIVWYQKMERMSHAQKYAFMVSELSKIYDNFKDDLSEEEKRHFETRLTVEKKIADRIAEIESDEQMKAQNSDMESFKTQKENRIRVKRKKVRRSSQ